MDGQCRVRAVTHGRGRAPEAPLPSTPAAPVPLEPLGGVLRAEQEWTFKNHTVILRVRTA